MLDDRSALVASFDGSCASFGVTVVSVGAWGSVMVSNFAVGRASAVSAALRFSPPELAVGAPHADKRAGPHAPGRAHLSARPRSVPAGYSFSQARQLGGSRAPMEPRPPARRVRTAGRPAPPPLSVGRRRPAQAARPRRRPPPQRRRQRGRAGGHVLHPGAGESGRRGLRAARARRTVRPVSRRVLRPVHLSPHRAPRAGGRAPGARRGPAGRLGVGALDGGSGRGARRGAGRGRGRGAAHTTITHPPPHPLPHTLVRPRGVRPL